MDETVGFFGRMDLRGLKVMRAKLEQGLKRERDPNAKVKMPWMVPAWTRGLDIVNELITHKEAKQ